MGYDQEPTQRELWKILKHYSTKPLKWLSNKVNLWSSTCPLENQWYMLSLRSMTHNKFELLMLLGIPNNHHANPLE
jgi:hypothetical protein